MRLHLVAPRLFFRREVKVWGEVVRVFLRRQAQTHPLGCADRRAKPANYGGNPTENASDVAVALPVHAA